jgi:hypothetical protein
MTEPLRILNFGGGTQSSAVLAMSCLGDLPKLDAAIFADTGWEPKEVYRYVELMRDFAERHGVPVITVTAGDLREHALSRQVAGGRGEGAATRFASLPLYTWDGETYDKRGRRVTGRIMRQCTKEYKIEPITKKIREMVGVKPRQRVPKGTVLAHQWFGISMDEMQRMKTRRGDGKEMPHWTERYYPLIEPEFGIQMRREGSIQYLLDKGFPMPTRSACIGCPFHHDDEWKRLFEDEEARRDAFEFDEAIRQMAGMDSMTNLHRSGRPLRDLWLEGAFTNEDEMDLFVGWQDECAGHCGI